MVHQTLEPPIPALVFSSPPTPKITPSWLANNKEFDCSVHISICPGVLLSHHHLVGLTLVQRIMAIATCSDFWVFLAFLLCAAPFSHLLNIKYVPCLKIHWGRGWKNWWESEFGHFPKNVIVWRLDSNILRVNWSRFHRCFKWATWERSSKVVELGRIWKVTLLCLCR